MRTILNHLTREQLRTLCKKWLVQRGRDKDTTICNLCAVFNTFKSPEAHLFVLKEICEALKEVIAASVARNLRQENYPRRAQ